MSLEEWGMVLFLMLIVGDLFIGQSEAYSSQ